MLHPHLFTAVQDDARYSVLLEVLFNSPVEMDRDTEIVPRIVENHLMQLASMPVIRRLLFALPRVLLVNNNLSSVVLVDVEAVATEVDGQRPQTLGDLAIRPSVEDSAGVRTERDNISKNLELREGFVYLDVVSMAMTLDSSGETTEP